MSCSPRRLNAKTRRWDLIIEIPDEMLQAIGVVVGDELSIEVVDGVIL